MILPVTYPLITHKPPVANLLSVIGQEQSVKNWMFEKYFNIYINMDGKADFWGKDYYYKECPFVRVDSIPREWIINYKYNFLKLCKEFISLGHYVCPNINTKYISLYNQTQDFDHGIFIYGFDDSKGIFYVADFFTSKYEYATCSYQEMETAFWDSFVNSTEYDESLFILKKKRNFDYPLNRGRIKSMIHSHLSCENLFERFHKIPFEESLFKSVHTELYSSSFLKEYYSFGLDFYDALENFIVDKDYYDLRALHLLYDRSKVVNEMIHILRPDISEEDSLYQMGIEYEKKALISRNLMIKVRLNNDNQIRDNIKKDIQEAKILDRKLSEAIYDLLEE